MVQALIPLGLRVVEEVLHVESAVLAGERFAPGDAHPEVVSWGKQKGSIFLADQKLSVTVPRVRDRKEKRQVPLSTYTALPTPRSHDLGLYRKVRFGISCRQYKPLPRRYPRPSLSLHGLEALHPSECAGAPEAH